MRKGENDDDEYDGNEKGGASLFPWFQSQEAIMGAASNTNTGNIQPSPLFLDTIVIIFIIIIPVWMGKTLEFCQEGEPPVALISKS